MASRSAEKDRRRRERLERERAAAARDRRARVTRIALAAVLVALAIGGAAFAAARASHGGAVGRSGSGAGRPVPPASALPGLRRTRAPWRPEYAHLEQRVAALGLPPVSDVIYHVHALLHVYVDGRAVPVPANVGIDYGRGFITSLHTHDRSGVIHMEATRRFPFRLSDFFDVWGVAFGARRLGGYTPRGASRVWVYSDGRRVTDPVHFVMRRHDNIVVAFGRAGSFPRRPSAAALVGY